MGRDGRQRASLRAAPRKAHHDFLCAGLVVESSFREEPMSKSLMMIAALATFVMIGVASAQQPAGTPPTAPIKRTILQKADVPGTNLEIIYATVEISAGFKA